MINTLYIPELREMLSEGNAAELREFCTALHPARTAEFMIGLSADESWLVLGHAPLWLREQIFTFFPRENQIEIFESQDRAEVAELIVELAADDRVDLLEDVRHDVVEELLPLLPSEERREILRLRSFPDGSAGAVMTTEAAKLGESLTVSQALDELQPQAMELETIAYVYIVDDTDHLRGVVSARKLVSSLGKLETRLAELMETDLVSADVMEDQESVAKKVAHYDLLAIPVVDHEHRLLGIITHDDIIDVVQEEALEDAHRIAGVEPLEESYLKTSVLVLSRKRGTWLVILFIAALATAFALRIYDAELERIAWLAWFLPLIISSGGNAGSQAATLIITALTAGDIVPRDWFRILLREIAMGLLLGAFLGLIGFIAAYSFVLDGPGAPPRWQAAMVIPITVLLVVICGTLCGALLPLLFQRLGFDPALMSSPFVAGIIDIVGILLYMNVGAFLLRPPGG